MGSEIEIPEEEHKLLAQCIEGDIRGEKLLLPYPEHIERLAQVYASQVISRLSSQEDTQECAKHEGAAPDYVTIDVDTIEKSEPRSVGAEHLMLAMAYHLIQQCL